MPAETCVFVPEYFEKASMAAFEPMEELGPAGLYAFRAGSNDPEAEREREKLRRIAAEAYSRGIDKGREEARVWKEKALVDVASVLRGIREAEDKFRSVQERELLRLSVAIAEKVIKSEISADVVGCLKNQIDCCIKQIEREVPVQIRLNPKDSAIVEELLENDDGSLKLLKEIRILEDRRVGRGGCIIETERGALNAVISSQLELLSGVLEKEYEKLGTR